MKRSLKKLPVLATVGPYAVVIILLVLIPVIYIALISIMTRPSYGGVEFTVSFTGYKSLFEHAYLVAIWNSLKMSLISTLFILLISYPMAYILSTWDKKRATSLIILMMLPYFTNGLVRLYSYITLFNNKGILSSLCKLIGVKYNFDFLYTESAVILGLIYVCIPYAVLPIFSSLERLNKSLAEASYDLGATRFQTFWKITFPLSMPVVLGNVILMLPYMMLTVRTRFLGFDTSIEEASMDLGANGLTTFFRITMPNVLPGIFSGALLSFALTLDDVIMADFLAGPNCLTFPMKVYNGIRKGVSPEINALQTLISVLIMTGVFIYECLINKRRKNT